MDFYQNLKSICDSKKTNISSVLTRCNLSKSYGTNWKKGVSPTLDVLIMLSNELNVSLDYLVLGKETALTEEQQELLNIFSQLSEKDRIKVTERALSLLENPSK